MSAYNFKKRWELQLRAGTKLTTLRANRKDRREPRIGEPFSAFVGMRTKHCRRLFDSTIVNIDRIELDVALGEGGITPIKYSVFRNNELMRPAPALQLARDDGFKNLGQLISFFEAEHDVDRKPFRGWLIRWAQPVTWCGR